jgi:hypothetical protein
MKTCATCCQRCHNRYDAPVPAAGIQTRAQELRAVDDLFA